MFLLSWDKLEHIDAHVLLIDLANMVNSSVWRQQENNNNNKKKLNSAAHDVSLLRLNTTQPLWMELLTSKQQISARPCTGGLTAACLHGRLHRAEAGRDEILENISSSLAQSIHF